MFGTAFRHARPTPSARPSEVCRPVLLEKTQIVSVRQTVIGQTATQGSSAWMSEHLQIVSKDRFVHWAAFRPAIVETKLFRRFSVAKRRNPGFWKTAPKERPLALANVPKFLHRFRFPLAALRQPALLLAATSETGSPFLSKGIRMEDELRTPCPRANLVCHASAHASAALLFFPLHICAQLGSSSPTHHPLSCFDGCALARLDLELLK